MPPPWATPTASPSPTAPASPSQKKPHLHDLVVLNVVFDHPAHHPPTLPPTPLPNLPCEFPTIPLLNHPFSVARQACLWSTHYLTAQSPRAVAKRTGTAEGNYLCCSRGLRLSEYFGVIPVPFFFSFHPFRPFSLLQFLWKLAISHWWNTLPHVHAYTCTH